MPKYEKIQTSENRTDLFVTGSVSKDFKKLREFYTKHVNTFIKAFDASKKILKIETDQNLWIRNLRSAQGTYRRLGKQVNIDLRNYNVREICSTIIHELTHAKQYESGNLKVDPKNKNFRIWKKTESHRFYRASQNHKKYMDQPWEVEARANEKKYINQVMEAIK